MPSKIVKSNLPDIKEELHYFDGPNSYSPSIVIFYNNDGVAVKETHYVNKQDGESYMTVITYDIHHQVYGSVKTVQGKVVHSSGDRPVTKKTGLHSYSNNVKGCPQECAAKTKN